MKKILEGSRAVAETVSGCNIEVVSAYPITPQTHIVEELAKIKADGLANFEYLTPESEFAAASIVLGACAAGARAYTATSSQGLLLMAEVLFNIAGMRLPVVLTCANRAVSAPINIWNDQQDIMAIRDSGWLIWFGETVQEVCDLHILAYKMAEQSRLPVAVNLDGFILTHVVEPAEIENKKKIRKFLPVFRPKEFLDVKNPLTFGAFATPEHYFEIREELHRDVVAARSLMAQEMKKFQQVFSRRLVLVEYYGAKDAETVLVAMGSVVGTIKDAIDEIVETGHVSSLQGTRLGVLKITSFRPFPDEEIVRALAGAKNIAVIDKSISLGTEGILATELRRVLGGEKKITSFILGLGGRDITKEMIARVCELTEKTRREIVFIGK